MNISIRLQNENDYKIVENMTREAFWDVYKPGCDEHLMVHNIRRSDAYIKELAFVACDGEEIVGVIIYTKAKVINEANEVFDILCMGPLGVLPAYQCKGIGSLLMEHSIKAARDLGYNAVAIFGNPDYYHRFGFDNAGKFNVQTSWGANFEDFMILELYQDSLMGVNGRFHEDSAFQINKEELEIFDKQFPYKEKHTPKIDLSDKTNS